GAHQEDGDDVGDDDGDDAAGRAGADVVGQNAGAEYQEGDVGGGIAGAAAGGDADFGEDAQQEDGLDENDDGDGPRHMRQDDEPEPVDCIGPVHFGGLALFFRERLQGGEQDQRGEGQPLPGDDDDDREQRILV